MPELAIHACVTIPTADKSPVRGPVSDLFRLSLKSAFAEVFETRESQSSIEELHTLKATLSAPGTINAVQAARFLQLLANYEEDSDLIHEIFMQLDGSMAAQLYAADARSMRRFIRLFVDDFKDKSWGFSYTDTIADRCSTFVEHIPDAEIHADIVIGLMILGLSHNRFYVLETFGKLIAKPTVDGEIDEIRERLRAVDQGKREDAAGWAPVGKLPLPLMRFFDFENC